MASQVQDAEGKFIARLADERLYMEHRVSEKGEKRQKI